MLNILWSGVRDDLEFFEKVYRTAMYWSSLSENSLHRLSSSREDSDALSSLSSQDDYTPIGTGRPGARWVVENYGQNYLTGKLKPARKRMAQSFRGFEDCLGSQKNCKNLLEDALDDLEDFYELLAETFAEAGPESFSYGGFRVLNPFRFKDSVLERVTDAIDYAKSLFKKRKVEAALQSGVKTVRIRPRMSLDKSRNSAGYYDDDKREITMISEGLVSGRGRMLENWIHEVFLHEFGHFVYDRLHPEARALWESPWKGPEPITVNLQERQYLFDILEDNGYDLQDTLSELEPLEEAKFRAWLYEPRFLRSLNADSWSQSAERAFETLSDPESSRLLIRNIQNFLGILEGSNQEIEVPVDLLEQYGVQVGAPPTVGDLSLPTSYKNEKPSEGFAETFAGYMGDQSVLSQPIKDLLLRVLWMSGFYGANIMRTASAKKVLRDYLNEYLVRS